MTEVMVHDTGEVVVEGEIVGELPNLPEGFNPAKWDDNVNLCQQTVEEVKDRRLLIGGIVQNVMARWGTLALKQFSKETGVGIPTLYEYRRVFMAFPDGGPAELEYSHLRTALKAQSKEDPEAHVKFAEETAKNGWGTRGQLRELHAREKQDGPAKAEDVTGQTKVCPACGGAGEVPA